MSNDDLFGIRNFGVKSLTELNDKLEEFGYSREAQASADAGEDADDTSETTEEASSTNDNE